jgi:hypothetical protein
MVGAAARGRGEPPPPGPAPWRVFLSHASELRDFPTPKGTSYMAKAVPGVPIARWFLKGKPTGARRLPVPIETALAEGETVAARVGSWLKAQPQGEVLKDDVLVPAQNQRRRIVGDKPTTALLAQMYIDGVIAKRRQGPMVQRALKVLTELLTLPCIAEIKRTQVRSKEPDATHLGPLLIAIVSILGTVANRP